MLNVLYYSSASASHPVGATFRIQGFLHSIPVRKEAAKRAASKTLMSIKKLLYTYAYARPSVRLAFKVLKTNNVKVNWSYCPKIGSISLQETTAKIAGQEIAAQCEPRSAELRQTVRQSAAEEVYSLDAVIAKTDAGNVLCALSSLEFLTSAQKLRRSITSAIMYL